MLLATATLLYLALTSFPRHTFGTSAGQAANVGDFSVLCRVATVSAGLGHMTRDNMLSKAEQVEAEKLASGNWLEDENLLKHCNPKEGRKHENTDGRAGNTEQVVRGAEAEQKPEGSEEDGKRGMCAHLETVVDALTNKTCNDERQQTPVCNAKRALAALEAHIAEVKDMAEKALTGEKGGGTGDTARAATQSDRRAVDVEVHCLASDIVWLCAVESSHNTNPCVVGGTVGSALARGTVRDSNIAEEWGRYLPLGVHQRNCHMPDEADIWSALEAFRAAIKNTHTTAGSAATGTTGLGSLGADCETGSSYGCVPYGGEIKRRETHVLARKTFGGHERHTR
ncbi:hypothetical protein, conserved in T. vivax, partial [Trypanosoma vivax Y486]